MCLVFPCCGVKAGLWHGSQSNKIGSKDEFHPEWNSGHVAVFANMVLVCFGAFSLFAASLLYM